MGRELIVIWAGRRRGPWGELCDDYRRRIARHLPVSDRVVRARTGLRGAERLQAEGEAMLRALPDPCWAVALDRRGTSRSSEELARWLERLFADWPHPVAFLVGSDAGLGRELLGAVRERLALGPLTLAHELARLVLYEQIYRALCIQRGIKYHRQPL